jgi:hypothetical protein
MGAATPPDLIMSDEKLVVFCIPTIKKPYQVCLDSLTASLPMLDKAGWSHRLVNEIGNPYISCARSTMLRKALDVKPRAIVFLDHDLSWQPIDMLTLLETEGDVVCGTYRFKRMDIEYMGMALTGPDGTPLLCAGIDREALTDPRQIRLQAHSAPAGFLKITPNAVHRFMKAYPNLVYGDAWNPHVDLFNHGAHEGIWYGEDYAFCRNWRDCGGTVELIPALTISHWDGEGIEYPGNYHVYLRQQAGGDLDPSRENDHAEHETGGRSLRRSAA